MTQDERQRIESFAECARRYMTWVFAPPKSNAEDMLSAQRLLSELHFKVLQLPESVERIGEGEPEIPAPPNREAVMKALEKLPVDTYWGFFNPIKNSPEQPVAGSLYDDLSDIYRDLHSPLKQWEMGRAQDALFEWRTTFNVHWGKHLVDALQVVYAYLAPLE